MSIVVYYVILVIAVILLIVSGVFATMAASKIGNTPNYENDPHLHKAHTYLMSAAIATWVSVGLAIIAFIAVAFASGSFANVAATAGSVTDKLHALSGATSRETTISTMVLLLMGVIVILALVDGVLAAMAAATMRSSPNLQQTGGAYNDAIIAAVAGLGGIGALIIGFFIYWGVSSTIKKEGEEERQKIMAGTEVIHSEDKSTTAKTSPTTVHTVTHTPVHTSHASHTDTESSHTITHTPTHSIVTSSTPRSTPVHQSPPSSPTLRRRVISTTS